MHAEADTSPSSRAGVLCPPLTRLGTGGVGDRVDVALTRRRCAPPRWTCCGGRSEIAERVRTGLDELTAVRRAAPGSVPRESLRRSGHFGGITAGRDYSRWFVIVIVITAGGQQTKKRDGCNTPEETPAADSSSAVVVCHTTPLQLSEAGARM